MKIEEIEKEVNKLESILTPCINEININLDNEYKWAFVPDDNIFSESEKECLSNVRDSIFKRNVNLKYILSKKLNDNSSNKNHLYNWILEWGGIHNSKKEEKDIEDFLKNLEKNINNFPDTISSLSKIASFKYLNKYFIYDARVSYVLNWLLLKNSDNDNINYFPINDSKNTNISDKYNMHTILTLNNKEFKFYDKKIYYFLYCKFIQSITKNNEKFKEPFYLEMMLFSMLENVIDEIKDKVKISIEK